MRFIISVASIAFIALTSGAAKSETYDSFKTGKLQGRIILQWWAPDQFVFLPDQSAPLTFTRSNGDTIRPGKMFTDGGSIPRPLWVFRNYSPWGYAPGFMIHDWLFEMKRCGIPGNEKYSHKIAATVMAEAIKTMMESGKVEVAKLTLLSMYEAVDSKVAEDYWNSGRCVPPPANLSGKRPIAEYEISFD